MPPGQELVDHARPDDPVPAGDGGFVTIGMPDEMRDDMRVLPPPRKPPWPRPEPNPEPTTPDDD